MIFSSRTIPGNERAVGRIHNQLIDLGCELLTDADALVHVTGHPRREELKEMYHWVRPRVAIPMHGEARHLTEHAKLARAAGVGEVLSVRNGDIVRLAPGPAEVIDQAPVGRLFRDGRLLVASRRRPRASTPRLGVRRNRDRVAHPVVRGANCWPIRWSCLMACRRWMAQATSILEHLLDAVDGTLQSIPPARRKDGETVREAVRRAVRARIEDVWGKRPITKVLLTQLAVRG